MSEPSETLSGRPGTSSGCSPTRCGRSSRPSGSRAGSRTRSPRSPRPPPRSSPTGPRSSPRASCAPCATRATGCGRWSRSAPAASPPAPWSCSRCAAAAAAGQGRPALARPSGSGRSGRRRGSFAAPPASPAPRRRRAAPRIRWRKLSSVLTGRKPRIDVAAADDEAPDGDDEVDDAEPERVLAGGVAGDEQAERAGEDVDEVEPGVDARGCRRRRRPRRGCRTRRCRRSRRCRATTSSAADQRSRRAGRGWAVVASIGGAIVGSPIPMAADLLPPPRPRDRRLLLLLRAADLPRVHDADPGRHALPGVRAASGPRSSQGRRRGRRLRRRPGDLRPDRAQRRRLPGRDRRRQRRPQRPRAARSSIDFGLFGPVGRRRRVVPARHRRLPPRRPDPHRLQHVRCSSSSAGCWSRRSARRASSPSTSPRCSPARSGRSLLDPERAHASAPRARSSASSAPPS